MCVNTPTPPNLPLPFLPSTPLPFYHVPSILYPPLPFCSLSSSRVHLYKDLMPPNKLLCQPTESVSRGALFPLLSLL